MNFLLQREQLNGEEDTNVFQLTHQMGMILFLSCVSSAVILQKWFVSNLPLIYQCETLFPNYIFYVIFMHRLWQEITTHLYSVFFLPNCHCCSVKNCGGTIDLIGFHKNMLF